MIKETSALLRNRKYHRNMKFYAGLHKQFVVDFDNDKTSYEQAVTEHIRASGIYWGISALVVMGMESALPADNILSFVKSCYHNSGGFAPSPGHDPHLLYTLSCLQILALLDALDELPDKEKTIGYIASLQKVDGSFSGDKWGEIDTRFSYCAFQALALLNALDRVNIDTGVEFIAKCMNFDGGFGAVPGAESHAGQVFCCVGALAIVKRLDVIDADLLGWWLAERQVDSGGLNGRPEKQSDVCYSWWILSSLAILGRMDWIDKKKLSKFILECQDSDGVGSSYESYGGGIADRPGNLPDVYHTFFGIAGLSLLGCFEEGNSYELNIDTSIPSKSGETHPVFPFAHRPIDPVYALPFSVIEKLNLPRSVMPIVSPSNKL